MKGKSRQGLEGKSSVGNKWLTEENGSSHKTWQARFKQGRGLKRKMKMPLQQTPELRVEMSVNAWKAGSHWGSP